MARGDVWTRVSGGTDPSPFAQLEEGMTSEHQVLRRKPSGRAEDSGPWRGEARKYGDMRTRSIRRGSGLGTPVTLRGVRGYME